MRPLIGISVSKEITAKGSYINYVNEAYKDAITAAGGIPILIPIGDETLALEYISKIDGLLLSGGEDIHPLFYNESPLISIGDISPDRDRFELALYKKAAEKKLPVLGICRGCQLINVAEGGTLYQDIDTQVENVNGHHPKGFPREEIYHNVTVIEKTVLRDIFSDEILGINSYHHQSVKKLPEGFKISAISEDRIIEAFERNDMNNHYVMAVQWHPEGMIKKHKHFLNLFTHFVEKCKK